MARPASHQDQGSKNRRMVLSEILRHPGISRTEIGKSVGLNAASVSRISRDLIEAGLVKEADSFGDKSRPGRRFVGLAPRGQGGFIVGIGMNAFRQSVTLADLENRKIAEWISPEAPSTDGEAFMRLCLEKADEMVRAHVPNRDRFFGVGIAIAAEIDKANGELLSAPVFGWTTPIRLASMVRDMLNVPLVLDTPSSAINKSEADIGQGLGVSNLITVHCSLGFGIGIRQLNDDNATLQEFGRVLIESKAPDGSGRTLSDVCGGMAILHNLLRPEKIADRTDTELGAMLIDMIRRSKTDAGLRDLLGDIGGLTAQYLSLLFDLCQPECILLAGPLATSPEYIAGFTDALSTSLARPAHIPEIRSSDLTPTGASRWLALRGNVAMADLDLETLKLEDTA